MAIANFRPAASAPASSGNLFSVTAKPFTSTLAPAATRSVGAVLSRAFTPSTAPAPASVPVSSGLVNRVTALNRPKSLSAPGIVGQKIVAPDLFQKLSNALTAPTASAPADVAPTLPPPQVSYANQASDSGGGGGGGGGGAPDPGYTDDEAPALPPAAPGMSTAMKVGIGVGAAGLTFLLYRSFRKGGR